MENRKKILIAVLGMLGIILTTAGVTVAWFTYSRTGVKENTITSGSITFHYQEGTQGLSLQDAMPMTDAQGKAQDDYFEFDITSKTSRTLDIPYYITVRRTADSYADLDSVVKVYLTKVDNGVESQVALSKFSLLNHYENDEINIPLTEKTLYHDTVLAGNTNYTQKYRLRMWVDYDANYIVQNGDENTYPLNNKKYALTVNVYGTGNDIGVEEADYRSSTEITTLTIGNETIESTDNTNYSEEMVLVDETVTKTVTIETENPGATVTVENLTPQAMNIDKPKVRRLSTVEEIPLEIKMGTNIFRITVTSANKLDTKVYNLTITGVQPPAPNNFAKDSWETIVYAIKSDNTSAYNLGATRSITLKNGLGTHTIRIANKSTPAACSNTGYSQTSCGFVLEFTTAMGEVKMTNNGSGAGGYPSSNARNYVNNTVLPAMPDAIKDYIKPTRVVSGYGYNDNNNQNYVLENEKLYLLDEKEVFGGNNSANTANSLTHQLEFYVNNTAKSYKVKSNSSWWLRTPVQNGYSNTNWHYVDSNGDRNTNSPLGGFNISPAFRIG